jgi:hypothetical protein
VYVGIHKLWECKLHEHKLLLDIGNSSNEIKTKELNICRISNYDMAHQSAVVYVTALKARE